MWTRGGEGRWRGKEWGDGKGKGPLMGRREEGM